ncbi:MAG: hypothetical protein J6M65_00040 [Eubacterium sp.]|nr:hypothetical protein [Eubacterium sp.]
MIYVFIVETGGAAKSDIYDMIVPQFPTDLSDDKKEKKVMNLLAELKSRGT